MTYTIETGPPVPVPIDKPSGVYTEIPPELVGGTAYLTTAWTARCVGVKTLIAPRVDCTAAVRITGPSKEPWHRSYRGVYSAEVMTSRFGNATHVLAMHGEDKNSFDPRHQNQVAPWVKVDDCASGYRQDLGVYTDCWDAYSGFVTVNAAGGPAVWPMAGYARSRFPGEPRSVRLSHGVQHPFIVRGHDRKTLYMTYYDTGYEPGGIGRGIRVARSLDSGRTWRTWVASNNRWAASIPKGGPELWSRSPAQSQPLFESESSVFVVARTTGGGYIGIDQGTDYTRPEGAGYRSKTSVRFSRDMVNWSEPIVLQGADFTVADYYSRSRLTYPRFLNAAGTSTKEISARAFNIIGVRYGGTVYRVSASLTQTGAR